MKIIKKKGRDMKTISNRIILVLLCLIHLEWVSAQDIMPRTQEELYTQLKDEKVKFIEKEIVGEWTIPETDTLPVDKSVIYNNGSIGGIKGNIVSSFTFCKDSTGYYKRELEKLSFKWSISEDMLRLEFSSEFFDPIFFQMEYITTDKATHVILIRNKNKKIKVIMLLTKSSL